MTETKPQAREGRRSAMRTWSIGATGGQAPAPAGIAGGAPAFPERSGRMAAGAGAGVIGRRHE